MDSRRDWMMRGKMGGKAVTHPLDISDHTSQVNRGNTFLMTYGVEAVIPLETGFPTLRMSSFTPSNNDGLLGKSLDLIEERRKNAIVQLAYY